MRPNRSSTNVDHETRRNDYYYHHSSRSSSQANNSTENVNGHASGTESSSRSSKRTTTSSSNSATAGTSLTSSLIKRMKSSSSNSVLNSNNNSSVNSKESGKDNLKSTSHSTSNVSNSNLLPHIEPTECHQVSLSGYLHEENESLGKDNSEIATADLDKYSETAQQFKKLVLEILEAKKNKLKTKHSNKDDSKKFFSDSKIKGILNLAEMKNLNRLDKYRLKESRKRLMLSKDKVDKIHLQLQNLQYEVMHLQKEQKGCSSFRSKDEALQLIDSDKFYLSNSVPEDLKHLITVSSETNQISISESATNDEIHKLHLARLDWELKQRISSEEELKLAEESRFRLEVEISAKRRTLAQFDPTLRTIIEASKPLVSQLNVPLQVYNTSHTLTPFLPQPLYVLYIQLCAYKGVFGVNYEVNINGTIEEAQEYQAKVKSELNGHFFNLDDDDDDTNGKNLDDDDEEIGHRNKSSKKSRFYHHHSVAEAAATAASAVPNLTTTSDTTTTVVGGDHNYNLQQPMDISADNNNPEIKNEQFIKKYAKLLQAHPIRVNLTFRFRHYHLICTFTYYPKFELIGLNYVIENLSYSTAVHPQFSVTSYESNVFSKLFKSSDTGYACPNSSIEHLLRRYEIDSFVKLLPYLGFTYDWAQRMAGIEYLNSDELPILSSCGNIRVKSSVAIDSLDKTIKAINFRFQARINLQEQIQEIQSKKCIDTNKFESLLDSNEMYDNLNKRLLKPQSTISLFERLSVEAFLAEMEKYPNKKSQLVEYFDRESSSSCHNDDDSGSINDIFDENNFIFKLVVENVLKVQLDDESTVNQTNYLVNAYLIIPHNYPENWPFFILTFDVDLLSNLSSYLESSWLRSLEEHINLRLPIKVHEQGRKLEESLYSTTLLLRQIYDLQRGLDVICEAREKLLHKANQSLEVYSGPKCVNSFVSMSIIQGRDHSLKFD